MPNKLSFLGLLLLGLTTASATELELQIDEIVARTMEEKRIPGLSLAIVKEGGLLVAKGYGLATIEHEVPATAQTVYPISSVSKIFTGLAVMRLVQVGVLSLEQSVTELYPDLPESLESITLRQLLNHTHGLEDFYSSPEFEELPQQDRDAMSAGELVAWSAARPTRFVPGEGWEYTLVGYVLLGQILEQQTGMAFEDVVAETVLDRAGLTTATYGGTHEVVPGRHPVLYEWLDERLVNHPLDFEPHVYPAGGMNSSVMDLAKLFIAIEGGDLLDKEYLSAMWTETSIPGERRSYYGLGWFAYRNKQGKKVVGHEGGGASWVIYFPEEHLAVIALSNMSGARADSLPHEIARLILDSGE